MRDALLIWWHAIDGIWTLVAPVAVGVVTYRTIMRWLRAD